MPLRSARPSLRFALRSQPSTTRLDAYHDASSAVCDVFYYPKSEQSPCPAHEDPGLVTVIADDALGLEAAVDARPRDVADLDVPGLDEHGRVRCPWHGYRYGLPEGTSDQTKLRLPCHRVRQRDDALELE